MNMKIIMGIVGGLLGLLMLIEFDKNILFVVTLFVLVVITAVLLYMKKIDKKAALIGFLVYFTIFIAIIYYLLPSYAISVSQGTVLSNNWWVALNWMKSNTAECATMATYWDPGHFITGIAQRPVIYDGAGQNNLLYLNATRINALGINITKYSEGINIETYDKGIKIVTVREGSNLTKSRMKDVASAMFTDNESLAVELLKSYRNNGCNEFYFIASSDLIFKSQWWTYFSTWDPTKICEGQLCKGDRHIYSALQLTKRRPLFSINAMGYEYQISDRQSMVVYEQNGTYKALFQQDNQFVRINRVIYPTQTGYAVSTETGAEVPGTILLADPSLSYIFYLPPQLENSMFTKMFFFNGASLKNFKFVKDWGGEVKLFKVKFDD